MNGGVPTAGQMWLAAAQLWLLVTVILVFVTLGAAIAAVVWFVMTPIEALIELGRRGDEKR